MRQRLFRCEEIDVHSEEPLTLESTPFWVNHEGFSLALDLLFEADTDIRNKIQRLAERQRTSYESVRPSEFGQ